MYRGSIFKGVDVEMMIKVRQKRLTVENTVLFTVKAAYMQAAGG